MGRAVGRKVYRLQESANHPDSTRRTESPIRPVLAMSMRVPSLLKCLQGDIFPSRLYRWGPPLRVLSPQDGGGTFTSPAAISCIVKVTASSPNAPSNEKFVYRTAPKNKACAEKTKAEHDVTKETWQLWEPDPRTPERPVPKLALSRLGGCLLRWGPLRV